MRWSRLKSLIEELFDPDLRLQIFCTVQRGERASIGRYWFMVNGKTIWDEPKNVSLALAENRSNDDAAVMTALLRQYLETAKDDLPRAVFKEDLWGLTDILRAADRRIGKRRLPELRDKITCKPALEIIELRLSKRG